MLGYYNYTVILTYVSLIISIFGMTIALNGNAKIALFCLLLSRMCDMFDGPIARTKERTSEEKEFGIQIDSLVDLVCFGVFPAVVGYSIGLNNPIQVAVLALYVLGGVIRLAYFNVQESIRQSQTAEKRKTYQGLPITTAALIFPVLYCVSNIFSLPFKTVYFLGIIVVGTLFVADIKIKKAGKNEMIIMGIVALCTFIYMFIR